MAADAAEQHRIAVGGRLGHVVGGNRAARAAAVVDHERLAELLGELGAQTARDGVLRPAGRERADQAHGARRPVVGRQHALCEREHGRGAQVVIVSSIGFACVAALHRRVGRKHNEQDGPCGRSAAVRDHRSVGRTRCETQREGIRPRRQMAGRDRRADEGARPVRRDHQRRIWRSWPAGHDLCRDCHADFRGVDGDHRHLQLPSDVGVGGRKIRDAWAEEDLAAEIRDGRDPRRPGVDGARRRH